MRTGLLSSLAVVAACAASSPVPGPPSPDAPPTDTVRQNLPRPTSDPATPAPPVAVSAGSREDSVRALTLTAAGRRLRDREGDTLAALARFREAIWSFPRIDAARWELGWTLQAMGREDAALRAWLRLRSRRPGFPGLARSYPIVEMRRDRRAAARSLLPRDPMPVEEAPRDGDGLTVSAVGDIQLGQGWRPNDPPRLPPASARPVFARIRDRLATADVTFGNLETALADSGRSTKCRPRSRNCYAFRAPTEYARTLADVGFDVVSVNNNHAGDFGEPGRQSTMAALDGSAVRHAGPSSGIASWETKGLRLGLIAFSTGEGPYRVPDIDAARRTVIAADREHDLIFVSFHAGAEGISAAHIPKTTETAYGENRGNVFQFSRAMVDAGADLVLGHGPHVLRGMEVYRGRLIAYSLGNFSAWHGFNLTGPLGTTVVLDVTLASNGVAMAAELHPVLIDQPGIPRPDPTGAAIDIVRSLSREDLGDPLFDEFGRWTRAANR